MSIPTDLIIAGFIILMIISLFSVGFTEITPLFIRNDFDDICNTYLKQLSIAGELSEDEIISFEQELTDIGLNGINIDTPTNASWGSDVIMEVSAVIKYKGHLRQEVVRDIHYKEKVKVFGIEN